MAIEGLDCATGDMLDRPADRFGAWQLTPVIKAAERARAELPEV